MIELNSQVNIYNKYDNKLKKDVDVKKVEKENLKKVCDDFESFFSQQLMDISLKDTNVGGKGAGSDIIKGMYTQTVTKNTGGNLGISDILYKFLSEK